MEELLKTLEKLNNFYDSKETLSYSFRLENLKTLKRMVLENEDKILDALKADLNKSEYESYLTEFSMLYSEINYLIKHLRGLIKTRRVKKSLTTFPASGYIKPEPYGVVLIMSPWNYPLQLSLIPLAGAIAGGNVALIKMSEYSINTTQVLNDLINEYFPSDYIISLMGDSSLSSQLLDLKFDKIFFTGSTKVGKIVLEKASKNLTPVSLELGGKSPVIVTNKANLRLAAKRIIWGKLINSGETCVAPDYVLVSEDIKDSLIQYLKDAILEFLGVDPLNNSEYPKIISLKHFKRLVGLIDPKYVIYGGKYDEKALKIEPTLLLNPDLNSLVMQEEIFGPILPLITYKNLNEAISFIKAKDKPLALYIFTNDKKEANLFLDLASGGAAVNDTILHMTPLNLPFGGVGASGMGNYHGKYTFKAFTREKGVLKAKSYLDLSLRYHPYLNKIKIIKKLFK